MKGSIVAIVTPMHANGDINFNDLEKLINWHIDNGNMQSSFRKISCVLNLTDSYKYRGGGTLIKTGNKPHLMPKEQGTLNIFPSYTLHKAKKVKKGIRETLVCWVGGEPYK